MCSTLHMHHFNRSANMYKLLAFFSCLALVRAGGIGGFEETGGDEGYGGHGGEEQHAHVLKGFAYSHVNFYQPRTHSIPIYKHEVVLEDHHGGGFDSGFGGAGQGGGHGGHGGADQDGGQMGFSGGFGGESQNGGHGGFASGAQGDFGGGYGGHFAGHHAGGQQQGNVAPYSGISSQHSLAHPNEQIF